MLLNIYINHKAYYGRGEGVWTCILEEGYCYACGSRMTSALSVGSDVRAILTFH